VGNGLNVFFYLEKTLSLALFCIKPFDSILALVKTCRFQIIFLRQRRINFVNNLPGIEPLDSYESTLMGLGLWFSKSFSFSLRP
jgi:hypothetical protein